MSADELKQAALEALAEQAIVSAPREIFKLFPNWEAELRAMLPHQSPAEIQAAFTALLQQQSTHKTEPALAFAKQTMQAALRVHTVWREGGGCASSARQIAVQAPDAIFARPSHFLEAACRASLSDRKQAAPPD